MRGHGKGQPHIHAAAVAFDRRVQKLFHARKIHYLVKLPFIFPLGIPQNRALRKTFSRPVSSGWNPVPTSNRDAMRPLTFTSPLAGAVTRERIFSNVLLPAPFRPIIPKISPCLTEKETSRKAQKSSENFSEVGGRRSEVGDRPPARRLRLGERSEV